MFFSLPLLLLSLLHILSVAAFKFSPKPSLNYTVEPGYESCSGFVGFVNMPIYEVLNGQENLHLNHMVFLHHSTSFCFNGIIETLNGYVKTKPFRISFDKSRHLTRLLSKSERHVKTKAKEIGYRRVEDHYYDIEVDTKKLIEELHKDHPDCLGINLRDVENAIGKDIIYQCITSEAPEERIWLLQTNQQGYEHQFFFSMQSPGQSMVNMSSMSLGKNFDMEWYLGNHVRIGYVAHRGFVPSHAMKEFLILSSDKKRLLEYKGANRPWEQQQSSPYAYAPNPSAAVIYDQTKILHGETPFHVLYNDPQEHEPAKINSLIFDGGYDIEDSKTAQSIQLVGYNMQKEIALTVETKSPIESIIINKGYIDSFNCTLDDSKRYIKCTVDSAGKPGPSQLLLFGEPVDKVEEVEPLTFNSINTAVTHIVIIPVFGLGIDVNNTENPHIQRTFTVCTIYKVCQQMNFEQTWLLPPFKYNGTTGIAIKTPGVTLDEFWKHVWDSIREEVSDRTQNIAKNTGSLIDRIIYILLWGILPIILALMVIWSLIMMVFNKMF